MAEYALLEKQLGGCDYTIACGTRLRFLNAITKAQAIKLVEELDDEEAESGGMLQGENRRSEVWLLTLESREDLVPTLRHWESKRLRGDAKRLAAEKDKQERAEYERLRAKFGGENA